MRYWLFLISLLFFVSPLPAREVREEKRIEFLIQTVEDLHGGVFIRNESEYDGKKAGEHLRMVLKKGENG